MRAGSRSAIALLLGIMLGLSVIGGAIAGVIVYLLAGLAIFYAPTAVALTIAAVAFVVAFRAVYVRLC
jgi:hypothetical protein